MSNKKVMEDCFAFINGKCACLNKLYCETEECKFYKRKEEKQNEIC